MGSWHFDPPSLSFDGGSNTYTASFSALKTRTFDYDSGAGNWKGRHDNSLSRLHRSPPDYSGKAVIFDREGSSFVFPDPYAYYGTQQLEQVKLAGGSYYLFEYSNPGAKLSHIWHWSTASESFVRVWVYAAWGPYGPSTVDEHVAQQAVTTPTFIYDQWAQLKRTTFVYFTGQTGYQDASTGDLIAVDEETYLSNGVEKSLARTVFRYHLAGSSAGAARQLRAVMRPASYRYYFIQKANGDATQVFREPYADLQTYQPDPSGPVESFLDEELEYHVSPSADALRLSKRVARNQGGTCGCSGSAAGTFLYSYVFNGGTPGLDQWKVQVRIDRDGTPAVLYKWFDYNSYGKRLVEATVDPADSSRRQVKQWKHSASTGLLEAVFYPSAISGYDPSTHAVTYKEPDDGLVYWYTYSLANDYLEQVKFSKGATGAQTQLWRYEYQKYTETPRFRYLLRRRTQYQPAAVDTLYDPLAFHATDSLAVKKQRITLPAVSTAHNGSGAAGYVYQYFDLLGRRTWERDAAGAVSYTEHHRYVNAVKKTIQDVNTSILPPPDADFNSTYPRSASWPDGGNPLHLTTQYDIDAVGRVKKVTEPHGRTRFYRYTLLAKGEEVTLEYPHLSPSGSSKGALSITVAFQGAQVRDRAEAALDPSVTDSETSYPTVWDSTKDNVADAISAPAKAWMLSRTGYEHLSGHLWKQKRYLDAANPLSAVYTTEHAYDSNGEISRLKDPDDGAQPGTITAYTYDFLGRLETTRIGTNDSTGDNMFEVERRYYDGATTSSPGLGDGKLTQVVQRVDTLCANDRTTKYTYDYAQEGRLVKVESPTGITRTLAYSVAGWLTDEKLYAGTEATGNLRAWRQHSYDARGQRFETRVYAVDPVTGSTNPTSDYTLALTWRSQRGEVLKTQEGGSILRKSQLDAAGRLVRSTVSWDTAESGYTAATDLSLSGDTVVTQAETLYDAGSNPIIEKMLDRQPAYATQGLLPHGNAAAAKARYVATWHDVEDRPTCEADYGDNGNANLAQRPASPPTASDALKIVATREYTPEGHVSVITEPLGPDPAVSTDDQVTTFLYDDLGRLTQRKENATRTDVWANRTTDTTYTPTDNLKTITASTAGATPGAEPQVTTYTYGVSPSQEQAGPLYSNRLLYQIDYPRSDSGPDQDNFAYNAQGEVKFKKDASGNKHEYTYTKEGSLASDVVSTLAPGFDGAVCSIWRTYDGIGRIQKVTSRNGTSATSLAVNGVLLVYEKYGLVKDMHQDAFAEATTSSLKVSYAYSYPYGGQAPGLRLSSTTYPSGLVVTENYTAGSTDHYLNRPTGRSHYGGPNLFSNEYLGLGRVLTRHHPQPQVDWKVTLDRFQRTATLKATYVPYSYDHNSYEYGYNPASQVTYRKEFTTTGQSEEALYNGLEMLNHFKRGAHNPDGTVPNPTYFQAWTQTSPPALDHSGNWRSLTTFYGSITVNTQVFNKSNEITSRDADPTFATYDANGNMLTAWNLQYIYDAWNRLVEVRGYKPTYSYQLLRFSYNGLHQKIRKQQYYDNGKLYYYGAGWQVLQEYDGSFYSPKYSYVWGTEYIDELTARRNESNATWEYYIQDANFNVVTRINSDGSVINRYLYTAYGVPTQLSSNWLTAPAITEDLYLFTGREYHQTAAIYDYRYRQYDPDLGRFIQRDPVGPWEDPIAFGNGYAYVGNEPINLVDPSGQFFFLLAVPVLWGTASTTTVVTVGTAAAAATGLALDHAVHKDRSLISRSAGAGRSIASNLGAAVRATGSRLAQTVSRAAARRAAREAAREAVRRLRERCKKLRELKWQLCKGPNSPRKCKCPPLMTCPEIHINELRFRVCETVRHAYDAVCFPSRDEGRDGDGHPEARGNTAAGSQNCRKIYDACCKGKP
ncbi:MAG: RHS repeat-associated core domain-containing protein [Planctomycetes bacterium]|nr:RHS repeat-associated core domain-containing protein [Planctomycetota bacterium]